MKKAGRINPPACWSAQMLCNGVKAQHILILHPLQHDSQVFNKRFLIHCITFSYIKRMFDYKESIVRHFGLMDKPARY